VHEEDIMACALSRRRSAAPLCLLLASIAAGAAGPASAQPVAPGFVASPEIYKVIAENEKFRVVEVTWKPGQKDQFHSHPDNAIYYTTNCSMRSQVPGGAPQQNQRVAGTARVQGPVTSHSVENIGTTDCRLIMFEPK
jgi:quercetin dioxygenase-like cupin family protein